MKPLLRTVVYDGYDFALLLNYFDGINVVLKAFQGKYVGQKDSPYFRSWKIRKQIIEQQGDDLLLALLDASDTEFDETYDTFFSKIEAAQTSPTASAFTSELKESIYPLEAGGIALIGSYHPGVVALVKSMQARYLPSMKAWKLANTAPIILKNNLLTTLALREDQVEILDGLYSIVEDAMFKADNNAIPEEGLPPDDEEGDNEVYLAVTNPLCPTNFTRAQVDLLLKEYEVYDYQITGVWHLVSNTSALLADDMGLGKTRQSVVAADILHRLQPDIDGKLLIICPASLIINWTREILMIDPSATIATQKWDDDAKWIVTNYERLADLVPRANRFLTMIIDEAHFLKESTLVRTRLAFDIAAKVPHRFLLTGTPILNRESEIHTLLRLSGHPVGNIPLRKFEEQFAGDANFRRQLNKRISEWMLRRTKDTVLKTLKGKQRQLQYIDATPQQRARYDAIANDPSLLVLPKITKLRQILESIKIDYVLEMIADMQPTDKTLIFCEYKETVSILKKRLADMGIQAVTVIGSDSNTKRQKAVDAFQDNPDVRVFIATKAAGIGYNLTAANYVIHASLPWTPALRDQAEDRAYRNGQTRLVIVKIPLLENTIDADLWEMLKHKHEIATDILDPEEAEQMAMEAFAMNMAV
jgi:SNF2 family DNA or RNA helicase